MQLTEANKIMKNARIYTYNSATLKLHCFLEKIEIMMTLRKIRISTYLAALCKFTILQKKRKKIIMTLRDTQISTYLAATCKFILFKKKKGKNNLDIKI